jgi:S-adenosylmethionine:tRNA ribosyltransferase-isomerase
MGVTTAAWPRLDPLDEALVRVDPATGAITDARVRDLPGLLRPFDLLVVNDAATLPASLTGVTERGEALELRLAGAGGSEREWSAIAFGEGDWRRRTEDRPPPPSLEVGERLRLGGLLAVVTAVSPLSPRLVEVRFEQAGDELWAGLYRHGRPIQYSYLRAPLSLAQVQTSYAARPWAVEPPSAGRPLRPSLLRGLRERGVRLAPLTHAAGLSSTGDATLDAALPLPERYEIPPTTVAAVAEVRRRGGRVVAAGTTVVRALEGAAARQGRLVAGSGVTDLRLGPGFRPCVVDGLLTGIHEPGTSHFAVVEAFAPGGLAERAFRHAEALGLLIHEFGDSSLVLAA